MCKPNYVEGFSGLKVYIGDIIVSPHSGSSRSPVYSVYKVDDILVGSSHYNSMRGKDEVALLCTRLYNHNPGDTSKPIVNLTNFNKIIPLSTVQSSIVLEKFKTKEWWEFKI